MNESTTPRIVSGTWSVLNEYWLNEWLIFNTFVKCCSGITIFLILSDRKKMLRTFSGGSVSLDENPC